MNSQENEVVELDEYSGGEIKEYPHTGVPLWLKFVYVILPIWGIVWFSLFWNGSHGFVDRGSWHELQKAAKTTFEEKK